MHADGGSTLQYGTREETLDHRDTAALLRRLSLSIRIPQRTRHGARITAPMAVAITRLGSMGTPRGLAGRMDAERVERNRQGKETSVSITLHDLDAAHDAHVPRPDGAGMAMVADAFDDPTLARLMTMHGVKSIVRSEPGVDLFWGGLEERQTSFGDANPYHRLRGLPEGMPPFMIRSGWEERSSCVAVTFGCLEAAEALYCQEAGHAWLGMARELPETVIAQLPGRPATDLVGHEALEGWAILSAFEHHPDDRPTAFNLEWRG